MGHTEKVTFKLKDKQELTLLTGQERSRYKGTACGILREKGGSSVGLKLVIHWMEKENVRTAIYSHLAQPLKCLLFM